MAECGGEAVMISDDDERPVAADGAPSFWRIAREHPVSLLAAGLGVAWLAVEGARRATHRRQPWRDGLEAGVRRARRRSGELFAERPIAVGAAAAALGVLAGLALPATRREDEALGERRDELLANAREAGREALAQSRRAARGAGDRVKESLREQELTPDQLAEKVRQVARDAVSSVHEAERDFLRGFDEGAEGYPAPARDF
jgi:hypothetical protein